MELKKAFIKGTGFYVPKKINTNKDLEKMVDTNDEWITTRTGIKERHIAGKDETTSTLGAEAGKMAIQDAGLKKDDIDMIITNTVTPDLVFPATSALIGEILNIKNAGIFDIEAACAGFIYGISIATQYIKTGECKNILVISSETLSRITDWQDRNTCVLFGDAAGAAIVSESNTESEIIAAYLGGDWKYKDLLYMPAGGSQLPASEETVKNRMHFIKMKGNETFKIAVREMSNADLTRLEKANTNKSDIKILIPHQTKIRIIKMVQKTLELPDEKVYVNLHKYGNTSAATVPLALAEAVREGKIQKGDILVLAAFGGGFTWGSVILRW